MESKKNTGRPWPEKNASKFSVGALLTSSFFEFGLLSAFLIYDIKSASLTPSDLSTIINSSRSEEAGERQRER